MAIKPEQRDDILKIVVGLFNGSPDGVTLSELSYLVETGTSIEDLADLLAEHSVFKSEILAGNVTIGDQVGILMDHFGLVHDGVANSAASQAEAYFTLKLSEGEGFGKIVYDAVTYLTTGTPNPEFADTVALLNNKVLVSTLYSQANPADDVSTMLSILGGVSASTPTTNTDAIAYLNGIGQGPNPGTNTNLTFGADVLVGTSGNDTFNAGIVNNGAGVLVNSLESIDSINGGSGKDTLNATLDGGTPSPALTGVEVVNVRAVANSTISFANATGVEQIWNNGSLAGTTLNVNAAPIAATFGIRNTTSTTAIDFADALTGTTDTLSLSVAGAGKDGVAPTPAAVTSADAANIEALSVAAAGENFLNVSAFTAVKTLTVTGSGSLDVSVAPASATLTTVNASGNSGGVTVDLTGATNNLTVTGGSGNDDITAGARDDTIDTGAGDDRVAFATGTLDADDKVDGGAGNDTIAIAGADVGQLDSTLQKGFETLEITSGASVAVDADGFDFSKIILSGTATGLTATNFDKGTVEVKVASAKVTVASVGTEDTLGLVVNAGAPVTLTSGVVNVPGLDVRGIETVNVSTTSALDDTTIAELEVDGVTTLSFAGAGDVTIQDVDDANTANNATTKVATVDLTAQKGTFTMAALDYGTTFKLGNAGDTSLNGVTDSRDTFQFTTKFDNDVLITNGNFGGDVTDDKIDLSALGVTGIDKLVFTNTGADLKITSDEFDGAIVLAGIQSGQVNANDFIF